MSNRIQEIYINSGLYQNFISRSRGSIAPSMEFSRGDPYRTHPDCLFFPYRGGYNFFRTFFPWSSYTITAFIEFTSSCFSVAFSHKSECILYDNFFILKLFKIGFFQIKAKFNLKTKTNYIYLFCNFKYRKKYKLNEIFHIFQEELIRFKRY
jgi:hypothetical protein